MLLPLVIWSIPCKLCASQPYIPQLAENKSSLCSYGGKLPISLLTVILKAIQESFHAGVGTALVMLLKAEVLRHVPVPALRVLQLLMAQQKVIPAAKLRCCAFSRMGLVNLLEQYFDMDPDDKAGTVSLYLLGSCLLHTVSLQHSAFKHRQQAVTFVASLT